MSRRTSRLAHVHALSCGLLPAATRPAPATGPVSAAAVPTALSALCLCGQVCRRQPRLVLLPFARGQLGEQPRRATVHRGSARRTFLREVFGALGAASLAGPAVAASGDLQGQRAEPARHGSIRITKLETFLVKPRWLFLKVHTDAGIVGLGEPVVEGRALTVRRRRSKEIEPYLVGKDPRQVVAPLAGDLPPRLLPRRPVLTSALSGIDLALWDIKGKALGVPVYELLGGPTRDRSASTRTRAPSTPIKTQQGRRASPRSRPGRQPSQRDGTGCAFVETPASVEEGRGQLRRAARGGRRRRATSASTSTARSARQRPSC